MVTRRLQVLSTVTPKRIIADVAGITGVRQVCLGYDIDEDVDTETNDRLLYSLSRVAARLQVSELGYHRNVCFRIEGRESSRRDAADV